MPRKATKSARTSTRTKRSANIPPPRIRIPRQWRVVTAQGRLVPGHEVEHARRLRAEGVDVVDGKVAFRRGRR